MGVFDLVEIYVGAETMRARPTKFSAEEFNNDGIGSDGSQVYPTAFETTCPYCGQLLSFELYDIIKLDEVLHVVCPNCGSSEGAPKVGSDVNVRRITDVQSATDLPNPPKKKVTKSVSKEEPIVIVGGDECPFQDPVAAGELRTT